MSSSMDAPLSPRSQLALRCFEELLDCAVADVASECHRIARLGLDRSVDAEEEELRVWAARAAAAAAAGGDHHYHTGGDGAAEEGGSKGGVDVFGQTHPAIAADVIECMNCGRPVVAGRFAPHLEKCMGKASLFVSARRVSLAVKLPSAFALEDQWPSGPRKTLAFLCTFWIMYPIVKGVGTQGWRALAPQFMAKGRRARAKITRSSTAGRTRSSNGSAATSYSP